MEPNIHLCFFWEFHLVAQVLACMFLYGDTSVSDHVSASMSYTSLLVVLYRHNTNTRLGYVILTLEYEPFEYNQVNRRLKNVYRVFPSDLQGKFHRILPTHVSDPGRCRSRRSAV